MALEARIRELGVRHRQLDDEIVELTRHPSFDDIELRELKRRKLRLKEELEVLRKRMN